MAGSFFRNLTQDLPDEPSLCPIVGVGLILSQWKRHPKELINHEEALPFGFWHNWEILFNIASIQRWQNINKTFHNLSLTVKQFPFLFYKFYSSKNKAELHFFQFYIHIYFQWLHSIHRTALRYVSSRILLFFFKW